MVYGSYPGGLGKDSEFCQLNSEESDERVKLKIILQRRVWFGLALNLLYQIVRTETFPDRVPLPSTPSRRLWTPETVEI